MLRIMLLTLLFGFAVLAKEYLHGGFKSGSSIISWDDPSFAIRFWLIVSCHDWPLLGLKANPQLGLSAIVPIASALRNLINVY